MSNMSGNKRKRAENKEERALKNRRVDAGPCHVSLASLHDRRGLHKRLSDATGISTGVRGVLDIILEYAGLIWPVLSENDKVGTCTRGASFLFSFV